MGFVSEELNETEKQLIKGSKASNMAVVYGKEASIWKVSTGSPGAPTSKTWLCPPPPAPDSEMCPLTGQKREVPKCH